MRIELAGSLGVGKSTVAALLEESGLRVVREDLSRNPYIELRVVDPERYGLLGARRFVSAKVEQISETHLDPSDLVVYDFALAAERAYTEHYLGDDAEQLASVMGIVEEADRVLGPPDVIVHLRCDPALQLERIAQRGRGFEKGHDIEFVRRITDLVDRHVEAYCRAGSLVIECNADLGAEATCGRILRVLDEMDTLDALLGPTDRPSHVDEPRAV